MEERGGSMVVRRPPPLLHLSSLSFSFPFSLLFLSFFFPGLPGFDSWWVMVKMVLERKMRAGSQGRGWDRGVNREGEEKMMGC